MNKLYIIGGPPRTGKTTIMKKFLSDKPMPLIETDSLQKGLRNMLIDDPFQIVKKINIQGWAEYRKMEEQSLNKKEFSKESHEHEFVRQFVVGMLDHYKRNNSDVALEGSIIEPDWIDSLKDLGFSLRVVFVGFRNESHADTILNHAKKNESDWINGWLQNDEEENIRNWVSKQVVGNIKLAESAKKSGYEYFDITEQSFDEYVNNVVKYLIEN